MAPSPDNASAPSPDSSSDSSTSPPSPPSSNKNSTSSSPPPKSSPPPQQSPPSSPPPSPSNNDNNNNNSSSSSSGGNSPPSPPSKDQSPPSPSQSSSYSAPPPSKSKSSSPSPPSPSDALTPPSSEGKSHSSLSHNRNDDSSDNSPSLPSSKSGGGSSNNHETTAVIIAAALGALILIILLIACVCCCKKKKKKRHHSMHYYADSGPKGNNSDYYGSAPPKWNNGTQGMAPNAGNKHPHPPGAIAPPPGAWQAPPPPPPMSSSDMSLAYSGPHGPPLPPPSPALALGFNKSTFSYDELAVATGNFSPGNLLGQGGFGYVYKGYLPNGKEIAVKQLKAGSGQGEREFHAEVDIISRVHHRHLVSLVGYCITGAHRMLVYEFVPNNTLEHHLHGKGVPVMDWPTRLKIALGSAKGLAYLHEDCHPRIIHRDIKTANILLDFKFEAMVADFGLAKLSQDNHTHVSTRIMGTFGYLAPEYASSGKLTEKSDVFSYGVMLLELITGRRPVDSSQMEDSLVDWARPVLARALTDGNYDELVDPRLEGKFNPLEMSRMAASAAASVRHSARRRPKMSQIVRALEGDVSLEDLNEGVKPGQSMLFSSSSDYDSGSYSSNMRQFRKVALASTDFSEDYSMGPTSEYGLNPSESGSSGELHGAGGNRQKQHQPV